VVSLPQNSILLEDIDVNNIPEDKDIIIDKKEKTLIAVGSKSLSSTSLDPSESWLSSKEEANIRSPDEIVFKGEIFDELTFEDFKAKYL